MIRRVLYPARKDGGRADSGGGEQKSTQEHTHDIIRKGEMLFQNEMENEGSKGEWGAGRDLNSYEEKLETIFKLTREKSSTALQKWIQLLKI